MTSRANIRFEGLIGLNTAYFDWSVEARPDRWGFGALFRGGLFDGLFIDGHESAGKCPGDQGDDCNCCRNHKYIVGAPSPKFPIRVESHTTHYRS